MTEADERLCAERLAMLKGRRRGVRYSSTYLNCLQARMEEMSDRLSPPRSVWFYLGLAALAAVLMLAFFLLMGYPF